LGMFSLFGKKKTVLEPMPQGSVPQAPDAPGFMPPPQRQANSPDEPIVPRVPGKNEDLDSLPDFGSGMPEMPMPKNDQIEIPDVKIPESRSHDLPDFSDYSTEQITDTDLSKLDIEEPENPELQQLKSAVGEPFDKSRASVEDPFALPDFHDHEDQDEKQSSPDENETASTQPEIHEDALPGFAEGTEESISTPRQKTAAEEDVNDDVHELEEQNLSIFGSEPRKKQAVSAVSRPVPLFNQAKTSDDLSLPSFDIREATINQQLFIDARDYERLLKETIIIDALAKRTTKRLMKIKDVSANQSKLLEKYHADLSYINEKLDHIDRVLFEQH
jgi:hypothetical protein